MTPLQRFKDRFRFSPEKAGLIGVEREAFVRCLHTGEVVPKAIDVLKRVSNDTRFGPELSVCQIETKSVPGDLSQLEDQLKSAEVHLRGVAKEAGCGLEFAEVGPVDMPLDYYCDDAGRNQQIVSRISPQQLEAACRVAGVHVHVGMPDHDTALRVYNGLRREVAALCDLGDQSRGERLRLYKQMATRWESPSLASWEAFLQYGLQQGFAPDPRSCHWLLRISVHGTIEFRMFGSLPNVDEVIKIAAHCQELCKNLQ